VIIAFDSYTTSAPLRVTAKRRRVARRDRCCSNDSNHDDTWTPCGKAKLRSAEKGWTAEFNPAVEIATATADTRSGDLQIVRSGRAARRSQLGVSTWPRRVAGVSKRSASSNRVDLTSRRRAKPPRSCRTTNGASTWRPDRRRDPNQQPLRHAPQRGLANKSTASAPRSRCRRPINPEFRQVEPRFRRDTLRTTSCYFTGKRAVLPRG